MGTGSFLGGGMRYLVSAVLQSWSFFQLPMGTFAVNILGCFILGFVSALPVHTPWLSPSTRLILTTGFCGGFTTFSTFMKENAALLHHGQPSSVTLYIVASLLLGWLAVVAGQQLASYLHISAS